MKKLFLINSVIICLLLSACRQDFFQIASNPTETSTLTLSHQTDPTKTEPPATDITDPNALTEDEVAALQSIFENGFYNIALGQTYADPREIDLFYLFYNGDSADWTMTDSERAFIQSAIPSAEHLDIFRAAPENMNTILQMCFGLSLSDMQGNGLEYFAYFDQTGCYYTGATAPALRAEFLQITGGTRTDNGNIQVNYTAGGKAYVMMLMPADGGYHILSNLESE